MELTKKKALDILHKISVIEQVVSQTGEKYKTNSSLSYCFLRNKLKLKKVTDEQEKIIEFLKDEFEKTILSNDFSKDDLKKKMEDKDYQKDYEKKFGVFIEESDKYKGFLDEDITVDFHKIKVDKLEGVELPALTNVLVNLSEYLIDVEE